MIDSLQAVSGPAGPIPPRPLASVRRTSTIDMTWPGGYGSRLQLSGRARDAYTDDPLDAPAILASAATTTWIDGERTIADISSDPADPRLVELVGCRGGGRLRTALDQVLPGEREHGTLLYLLLDDISGTSLIARVAWARWDERWRESTSRRGPEQMANVCIGFRPGSMALVEIGRQDPTKRSQPVQALHRSDDPHGWHELPALPDVSVRRSRFINVSICDDSVVIEAGFQDRVGDPTVGSVAIHEYRIQARADVRTLTLTALSADPRILPFRECPAAAESAQLMLGAELGDFRSIVLDRLAGTSGCTHLNDALRGFADVPVLLNALHAHR